MIVVIAIIPFEKPKATEERQIYQENRVNLCFFYFFIFFNFSMACHHKLRSPLREKIFKKKIKYSHPSENTKFYNLITAYPRKEIGRFNYKQAIYRLL